ncbi:MAG: IS3 family transposase [Lacrimispora sphenoides]
MINNSVQHYISLSFPTCVDSWINSSPFAPNYTIIPWWLSSSSIFHLARCTTNEELCTEINDSMDYYNNEHYQWELAKLSPNQYAEYLRTDYYPIEV